MGRIRLRRIVDASAASLEAFVEEAIQPGSLVHTDGWEGYAGLENKGYRHEVTVLRGKRQSASKLLPRVHRVASLLKGSGSCSGTATKRLSQVTCLSVNHWAAAGLSPVRPSASIPPGTPSRTPPSLPDFSRVKLPWASMLFLDPA